MLIEFKCKNFKSFHEGFEFIMKPENRLSEFSYSILKETIGSKVEKALATSVIYGPNAAGKTSIINAMSCFKQIIFKGNIEDSNDDRNSDHVSANMNLIPFSFLNEVEPVEFGIIFTHKEVKYRYEIQFIVGEFMNKDGDRAIVKELLFVNDTLIFDRSKDEVSVLNIKAIKKYLNIGYDLQDSEKHRIAMQNNLNNKRLMLITDFYSFCSKAIVDNIKEWFDKQFIVINSSDRIRFLPNLIDNKGSALIDVSINEIAKEAGIVGSDFAYVSDEDSDKPKLVTIIKKNADKVVGLDAEQIESVGTLRLISIMPAIIASLKNGSVLVMDELDASLHPMIIMNLITIFHNDDVNKKHAQLIFNTHNPIYLNNNLLRRDEIKFVEKDKVTKSSVLYSLSDFKTNGEISVRKTSDYMKNYFVSRYGAIEDIDFTDIILELLNK